VIVGAETIYCTEIAQLRCRGQSTGRFSVDVDVDPTVDQRGPVPVSVRVLDECLVPPQAYERSAQRNVALMYALAPNSRAEVFTLMQLRNYSAGIRITDRFAQTVKGRCASINMENSK
jgi:hypothetical protein